MANGTLLCISGSLRQHSFNTKLVKEAARIFDAETTLWADLRLPLYDQDLEADGLPEPVQTLIGQISSADAVAISTPEYNKAPPGVLKNALDWVSRTKPMPLTGKRVAIMSASAGRSGGERAQYMLRHFLVPHGAEVVHGPEVLVGSNFDQFDGDRLINEINLKALTELMGKLREAANL